MMGTIFESSMKIKYFVASFFLFSGLFLLQTGLVKAQFTILPYTDHDMVGCQGILNKYVSTGVFPTVSQNKSDAAASKANAAASKANQAQADEKKTYDALIESNKNYNKKYGGEFSMDTCTGKNEEGMAAPNLKDTPECQDIENKRKTYDEAKKKADQAQSASDQAQSESEQAGKDLAEGKEKTDDRSNLLGCAIKTGRISLQMIPYFMVYIINFALGLVGLVSVLFIVVGGYYYVFGGLTEGSKDKGKKAIEFALMGMAVALLAWTIVNVIIRAVTG